jgi:hypothetical protein
MRTVRKYVQWALIVVFVPVALAEFALLALINILGDVSEGWDD